jgi:membrane protein required for colicin V production
MITLYDGLMLLVVIVAVLQGAWRGMAWQLAPLASLVLGYIISYPTSLMFAEYFGKPPLNRLWAMIAIYLLVSMVIYMIARSIRHSLEKMRLVEFDRHLGALLGGVKGVLFTVVLTLGLITVSDQARDIILKSESSTITARLMNTISPILPQPLNDLVHPYVKNLNDQLPEIKDNPTFKLPKPPVLIPNRIASKDQLAKSKRFDTEDDFVPVPGSRTRTTDPEEDDFGLFDNSPVTTKPPSRKAPAMPSLFEDEEQAPPPTRRPSRDSEDNFGDPEMDRLVPEVPAEDDFFSADPDKAFPARSTRPR